MKNAHLSVVYLHIFDFLFGFLLAAKIEEQVKILVFSVFFYRFKTLLSDSQILFAFCVSLLTDKNASCALLL